MKIAEQLKRFISRSDNDRDENEELVGKIVISQKGRDKDTYNIIMSLDDEPGYVYIANGRGRRVQSPKKKKLKHLIITEYRVSDDFIRKNTVVMENGQVREAIRSFFESSSASTD